LILFCALLAKIFVDGRESDVIELNDSNFEHLTQASTGGTTGDWLLEFYAPWCGHCQRLTPVWEEVATHLKGKTNVAKIDATANLGLGRRFKINGFPTIVILKRGKLSIYQGQRTKDAISQWALTVETTDEIPPPPSMIEQLLTMGLSVIEDLITIIIDKPIASGLLVSIGGMIGFLIGLICGANSQSHKPKSASTTSLYANQSKPQQNMNSTNNNTNNNNNLNDNTNENGTNDNIIPKDKAQKKDD